VSHSVMADERNSTIIAACSAIPGESMWAIDFCNRRSSECIQIAEECTDAGQGRAWLELAKEWVKLSEEVIASNYVRARRNVSSS
jgi:hypothetical protein